MIWPQTGPTEAVMATPAIKGAGDASSGCSRMDMNFMRKSRFPLVAGAALTALGISAPANAAIVGADAAVCEAGKPSLLVHVNGFKQPTGTLKLAVYGSDPAVYLKKQGRLRRIKVP